MLPEYIFRILDKVCRFENKVLARINKKLYKIIYKAQEMLLKQLLHLKKLF